MGTFSKTRVITEDKFYLTDPWQSKHLITCVRWQEFMPPSGVFLAGLRIKLTEDRLTGENQVYIMAYTQEIHRDMDILKTGKMRYICDSELRSG